MSPEEELQALKKEKQDLRAKLTEVSEALAQMTQRVAELEARLLMALCSSHQLRAGYHVSSKNKMRRNSVVICFLFPPLYR
jgi:predicted  nucleic acid-binding Zn-ribbon protein